MLQLKICPFQQHGLFVYIYIYMPCLCLFVKSYFKNTTSQLTRDERVNIANSAAAQIAPKVNTGQLVEGKTFSAISFSSPI
jgi:hypothetical protein